ncbi:calpain-9-like isoform X1 [Dermatophagoides pteronyssinus]|uniref:calpain-9-like isoform X1 n=1 Tax=Dermatophagoides pteronyssinus TaxID=6956 RepID=UPI003F680594
MAAAIVSDIINCFHFENGKIVFRPPGRKNTADGNKDPGPNLGNIMGMLSQFRGPAINIIRNVANEIGKELKIGHVVEKVEKMDEKILEELKNAQWKYKNQKSNLIKSDWRESITSLKPQDHFFKLGERRSGLTSNYSGPPQDYAKLKEKCLLEGQLFDDPAFPANDQSYYLHGRGPRKFKWLRPNQIVNHPKFISHGAARFDVNQGELGNCWFLAAVANLTMNEKYFDRVVPPDQSFDKNDYAGIFHFRFWQYGKWIDVVVDDRLPTINGKLVMMHSEEVNEFWGALLEKAYAKLHGSYESLKGGTTSEAMEDFTGGLTEHYEIQTDECPPNLFTIMHKGHQRGSFMGCSISVEDASQMEAVMHNGLIKGHAYSITSVKYVHVDHVRVQGKLPLVRIRNPWGNEAEWTGAWSDKSREWSIVSSEEKQRIGLTFDADGEFWMSFADFQKNFTNIEITNLTPDSLDDDSKKAWQVNYFEGQWIPGVSAGGCRNHLNTFYLNPQYMITLTEHDDDDELCTCVVALMQKNHRIKRKMGLDNLTIGFVIYEVNENSYGVMRQSNDQVMLTTNFFKYNASCARSPAFINLREVNGRYRLKPGRYCIIPSTFEPNSKGDFIIRFFTEKPAQHVMENDEEMGISQKEDIPVSPGTPDAEDNTPIYDGPPIDETIVHDFKPDPDPLPYDDRGNNASFNFDLMRIINMCIPLFSMANDCYQGRNVNTNDFFNTALNSIGMGHQKRAKRATDLRDGPNDIGDPYDQRPEEKSAYKFFSKIAGDDMEVDAMELQKVINHVFKKELKFEGFSVESCRSMIALMDTDASGKLGFDEFVILWRHLRNWSEIFKKFDTENNMAINSGQLKAAFREVGINVNRVVLRLLVNRYCHRPKEANRIEDEIYFNDFICCALKIKRCIEIWNSKKIRSSPSGPTGFGDFGSLIPGALGAMGAPRGFGNAFSTFAGAFGGNHPMFNRQRPRPSNESSFTLDEFIREVLYS